MVIRQLDLPARGFLHVGQGDQLIIARGAEIAQVFAREGRLVHVAPQALDLAGVQASGVIDRVTRISPFRQPVGAEEQLGKQVHARRRADEQRPAPAIGERGLQDVLPDFWLYLRDLIDHHAIQAHAPERIGVIAAEDADHGAVMLEPHRQVAFVHRQCVVRHERREALLEPRPCDGLGLLEVGCDIDKIR